MKLQPPILLMRPVHQLVPDVVYFDQDNGLRYYNPTDKTHKTVVIPSKADAVTGISIARK